MLVPMGAVYAVAAGAAAFALYELRQIVMLESRLRRLDEIEASVKGQAEKKGEMSYGLRGYESGHGRYLRHAGE